LQDLTPVSLKFLGDKMVKNHSDDTELWLLKSIYKRVEEAQFFELSPAEIQTLIIKKQGGSWLNQSLARPGFFEFSRLGKKLLNISS
jgi:hypothetical protein